MKKKAKRKVKAVKQKPVKVKEPKQVFKVKKTKVSKVIMGKHFFNEMLASDKDGNPIVTQGTFMDGKTVVSSTIFDVKNNVIIKQA